MSRGLRATELRRQGVRARLHARSLGLALLVLSCFPQRLAPRLALQELREQLSQSRPSRSRVLGPLARSLRRPARRRTTPGRPRGPGGGSPRLSPSLPFFARRLRCTAAGMIVRPQLRCGTCSVAFRARYGDFADAALRPSVSIDASSISSGQKWRIGAARALRDRVRTAKASAQPLCHLSAVNGTCGPVSSPRRGHTPSSGACRSYSSPHRCRPSTCGA